MNVHEEFVVEAVSTWPQTNITFGEVCRVTVRLGSQSTRDIEIDRVDCVFQAEAGFPPFVVSSQKPSTLRAGHRAHAVVMDFVAKPSMAALTNSFYLEIHYTTPEGRKVKRHEPHRYLIVAPAGETGALFFLSHKDPADVELSRLMARLLEKVGHKGYLAEDDKQPGVSHWSQKIPEAIQRSVGVIVVWTAAAASRPQGILREVEMAEKAHKPVIPVVEQGVGIPDWMKSVEYYTFRAGTAEDVEQFIEHLDKTYRHGGYNRSPHLETTTEPTTESSRS